MYMTVVLDVDMTLAVVIDTEFVLNAGMTLAVAGQLVLNVNIILVVVERVVLNVRKSHVVA